MFLTTKDSKYAPRTQSIYLWYAILCVLCVILSTLCGWAYFNLWDCPCTTDSHSIIFPGVVTPGYFIETKRFFLQRRTAVRLYSAFPLRL